MVEEVLPNPIEEFVKHNVDDEPTFKELFEATPQDVDLKTSLSIQEIMLVNCIKLNGVFLDRKVQSKVYSELFDSYLRLKISCDRMSRAEFVDINRKERFEQNLQRFGNFQNLAKVKE